MAAYLVGLIHLIGIRYSKAVILVEDDGADVNLFPLLLEHGIERNRQVRKGRDGTMGQTQVWPRYELEYVDRG